MTHTVSRNTCYFGAVTVGASLLASLLASCSGTIARSQNPYTTHSFKKASNLGYNSILPQSPQNTTLNRKFFAVGFETAIGGGV